MLPRSTLHNSLNSSGVDSKLGGQLGRACDMIFIEVPNRQDFVGGEFVLSKFPNSYLTLYHPIMEIVAGRSEPQVNWINAQLIVCDGAIMENPLTLWDWTVMQYPRRHMRPNHTISRSSPCDASVTRTKLASRPNPAPIHLCDFGPESESEGFGKPLRTEVINSNVDHSGVSARTALQGLPGYSFYTTTGEGALPP